MNEELKIVMREIEALAAERDDFLDITALPGSDGWDALVRKMSVEENMQVQRLLTEKEPSEVRYIQGFLGALHQVKACVSDATESAKTREEEIAVLTQQKDDLLDQQE